jgi:CheY-like chemotaxis protein
MSQIKILIVEDEHIVARDLQSRLIRMGYDVPEIASSGDQAMSLVALQLPDLILTDIRLGTEPDGIDLAAKIRLEYDLPFIYITAFTDEETVQRAQVTQPYGYVTKPFQDRELQISIELAIYKHKVERELDENRNLLSAILQSIGDAVIVTDVNNLIIYSNPAAEALTEWTLGESKGKDLSVVFNIVARKNVASPWIQFSDRSDLRLGAFSETILISRNWKERSIHSTVSELKNIKYKNIGSVVIFREAGSRESPFLTVI